MNAMSSPAQSEFYAGVSPVEAPMSPADVKNNWSPDGRRPSRKRALRTLSRLPIAFCVGVAATLAWQSYGDTAREMIANAHPQLGWRSLLSSVQWRARRSGLAVLCPYPYYTHTIQGIKRAPFS